MMHRIPLTEESCMHLEFLTPFWGVDIGGACRFLEERMVQAWLRECDRLDHGLAKLNGGSPSHCGNTCSPQLKVNWGGNSRCFDPRKHSMRHRPE